MYFFLVSTYFILTENYWIGTSGGYENYERRRDFRAVSTLIHVTSLLLFSVLLLVFGLSMIHKLTPSSTLLSRNHPEFSSQIRILTRINTVLFICTVCFLLRVLFLGVTIYETLRFGSTGGFLGAISTLEWFIVAIWIPSIGPVILLLIYRLIIPSFVLVFQRLLMLTYAHYLYNVHIIDIQSLTFLYIMKTTKPTSSLAPRSAEHTNPIPRAFEIESNERMSQQISWYYEDNSQMEDGDSANDWTASSVTNVMQANRSYSADIWAFARLMKERGSTQS